MLLTLKKLRLVFSYLLIVYFSMCFTFASLTVLYQYSILWMICQQKVSYFLKIFFFNFVSTFLADNVFYINIFVDVCQHFFSFFYNFSTLVKMTL